MQLLGKLSLSHNFEYLSPRITHFYLICVYVLIILKWILETLVLFLYFIFHHNTEKEEFLESLMRFFS